MLSSRVIYIYKPRYMCTLVSADFCFPDFFHQVQLRDSIHMFITMTTTTSSPWHSITPSKLMHPIYYIYIILYIYIYYILYIDIFVQQFNNSKKLIWPKVKYFTHLDFPDFFSGEILSLAKFVFFGRVTSP